MHLQWIFMYIYTYIIVFVFLVVLDLCCYVDFLQLQRAGLAPRAAVFGLPTAVASLVGSTGSRRVGLSGFRSQALEHRFNSCSKRA